jgi:hypothetical protein
MSTVYPPATYPATATETTSAYAIERTLPYLSWGAIIGGTVAAIGIQILLSALGMGAGLAIFNPMTDTDPTKHFSEGATAIWTGCALVALFFGAAVAGRFSASLHHGMVHGIIVWSCTLIVSLLLLSVGTGIALGGALRVIGEGLGIGTKAVAAGAGDVVGNGAKRTTDQLNSFINEAVQSVPTNSAPKAAIRAQREIGFAATRLFTPGNDVSSPTDRAALVKALVEYNQMSEADATKTVDDWTAAYKELQSELADIKAKAEQKAKETADEGARELSKAGTWLFFGLLLGLLVSAGGGILGAESALKRLTKTRVPQVPVN